MNPVPSLRRTLERSLASDEDANFKADVSFGRHRAHTVGRPGTQPWTGGATGVPGDGSRGNWPIG